MTDREINKLDRRYQQIQMEAGGYESILGGNADCCHHMLRKPLSLRWWLPGGVLLTTEQHNIVHSSDPRAEEMEEEIIKINGKEWHEKLKRRKHITVKYLTYEKVLAYLNWDIKDYI